MRTVRTDLHPLGGLQTVESWDENQWMTVESLTPVSNASKLMRLGRRTRWPGLKLKTRQEAIRQVEITQSGGGYFTRFRFLSSSRRMPSVYRATVIDEL